LTEHEAVGEYINATKTMTECRQKRIRISYVGKRACKEMHSYLIYQEFVSAWMQLQSTHKKEEGLL
jgi:hypothetical protein